MLFLNARTLPVGGGTCPIKVVDDQNHILTADDLKSAICGRNVLFVTHGFNVNQADGIQKLRDWSALLALGNAVAIGLLWPGDARWIHVIDYPIEGNEAMSSGDEFATFINVNCTAATSLGFASHSLGARVVLQTIRGLDWSIFGSVRRLLMMAGAVDDNCLGKEYAPTAANVDRISVLASRKDTVLEWAYPVGNVLTRLITFKMPYTKRALGREGPAAPYPTPNNIQAGWQLPDAWAFNHGSYLPGNAIAPPQPPEVLPPTTQEPPDGSTAPPLPLPLDASQPLWSAAFESLRWL